MFICKICAGTLSGVKEISGTYCGHMFHRECLDKHLAKSPSSLCPSCWKSLRVDITSNYAVLPLYPEVGPDMLKTNSKQHKEPKNPAVVHENVMLKGKLVEIFQELILLQKECKKHKNPPELMYSPQGQDDIDTRMNGSDIHEQRNEAHKSTLSLKRINVSQEILEINNNVTRGSSDTTASVDGFMIPDLAEVYSKAIPNEDRYRVLRSKRREYLTWRNKAQSWLSKMELACERIIKAEDAFTPQEYLQELRMFFNKSYNQGGLIETAKEAAVVYLVMEEVCSTERKEINDKIQSLDKSYCDMMTKIMDHLNRLEEVNRRNDLRQSENDLEPQPCFQSVSSTDPISDRCSQLTMSDDEMEVDTDASGRPNQKCSSNALMKMLFSPEDDDVFREPIYV